MKRKLATEIISLLFIFLFVYAGLSKLMDVEKFRIEIGQSPLLTKMASFIAWFIPLSEIAVTVLLAIPRFRMIGLLASFGLMVLFSSYIVAILGFSENIPCSCGGVLASLGWTEHLIFNGVFVVLAAAGILFSSPKEDQEIHTYVS